MRPTAPVPVAESPTNEGDGNLSQRSQVGVKLGMGQWRCLPMTFGR
jgi:hypothetical protein